MNNYRYTLESPRVTGHRQQKTVCPQCGRKSLVRYVDTENQCQYLHDAVGKCDHENSCGYHYKPSEFFHDYPQHRSQANDCRMWTPKRIEPPKPEPLIAIDMDYVQKSCSTASTFWQWITSIAPQLGVDSEALERIREAYYIGATGGSVIFWQINEQMQVHTGHIMGYNIQGHRNGYQNWTHCQLKQQNALPTDYQPPKCFFGQHLIHRRPNETVAIVESEKTAIVMSLIKPQLIWLATAGCGGLSLQKTACLKGRNVVIFPDSGSMNKWHAQMQLTEGIGWRISKHLERYPPNTDLVDLLGL